MIYELDSTIYCLSHLSHYYTDERQSVLTLKEISLSFSLGEFVVITGRSGSGKSTLLRILALQEGYDEGHLFFQGKDIDALDDESLSRIRRQDIAVVSDTDKPLGYLSSEKAIFLSLCLRGFSRDEAKTRSLLALKSVGLQGLEKTKVQNLSEGQTIRLSLAQALASDAPILLLDEITAHLDVENTRRILDILKEHGQNRLVLFVTHDFESVRDIATRHIVLEDRGVAQDEILAPKRNVPASQNIPSKGKPTVPFGLSFLPFVRFVLLLLAFLLLSLVCLGCGFLSSYQFSVLFEMAKRKDESSLRFVFDTGKSGVANPYAMMVVGDSKASGFDAEDSDGLLSFLPLTFSFDKMALRAESSIVVDFLPFLPKDSSLSLETTSEEGFYVLFNSELPDISYFRKEESMLERFLGTENWLHSSDNISLQYEAYLHSLPLLGYGYAPLGQTTRGGIVLTPGSQSRLRELLHFDLKTISPWNSFFESRVISRTDTFFTEGYFNLGLSDFEKTIPFVITPSTLMDDLPIELPAAYYEKRSSLSLQLFSKSVSLEEFLSTINDIFALSLDIDTPPDQPSSVFVSQLDVPTFYAGEGHWYPYLLFSAFGGFHVYYYQDADLKNADYSRLLSEGALVYRGDESYSIAPEIVSCDPDSIDLDEILKDRHYKKGDYESWALIVAFTLCGIVCGLLLLSAFILRLTRTILEHDHRDLQTMRSIGLSLKGLRSQRRRLLLVPSLLSFLSTLPVLALLFLAAGIQFLFVAMPLPVILSLVVSLTLAGILPFLEKKQGGSKDD